MLSQLNNLRVHNDRFDDALREAFERVLESGWFALGPEVEAFESEFADYCGAPHCVGVANGTDALELAIRGLGIGRGDEVITAANAGMYSTTAILASGATPSYADIQPSTLTLCPQDVAARIGPATRAIVVTHLFGRLADVDSLRALADRHGLAMIEDCAQAHGAERGGKRAGFWGDAAAFSFYPTKNLGALGDGGAVLTRDPAIAAKVRQLRQYGWESKYVSSVAGGRNSRLDELQAALLRAKLPNLDALNEERRTTAAALASAVSHPGITKPDVTGEDFVAHLFVVQTERRASLQEHLRAQDIASDIHYPVLDYQQVSVAQSLEAPHLEVSERLLSRILTLPCYPELSAQDIARLAETTANWDPQ